MTDRLRIWLCLAPALMVIGGLFLGGLGVGVLRSVGLWPGASGGPPPGFGAYARVLAQPGIGRSFLLTFHIAFTSTLIAAGLAVAAALLLRRQFPGRAVATFLFQLNLTIPHLVGAIGILYLFSQSGSFARLATAWHLIDRPAGFPALVFDPYAIGIILLYVWKEVPFIGVIVLANLQALGDDPESVARTLGASRWQALVHVVVPMILPGLIRASALVFAFAFGSYEIPALLGASAPAALPVLAYRSFADADLASRPQALALAILIGLSSGAMMLLALRLARRRTGG